MKTTYNTFRITATYLGTKNWNAEHSTGLDNWNNHRVTIYNSRTRKRASFEFWASYSYPELCTRYDTLNAFYCIVSDAIAGTYCFDFFCDSFGYDNDSRKAEKTHKTCIAILDKLKPVIGTMNIHDLANELSEVAA